MTTTDDIIKQAGMGSSIGIIKARADLQQKASSSKGKYKLDGLGDPLKFPEYVTGARAVVYVNDKKVAACMSVSWSIDIDHQEIRTIDSNLPWELVPSQIGITASLRRFIHPDRTAAGDHLFTIIKAALHTPTASIEVRDRLGNPLFYAKGSFVSLKGQVAVGSAAIEDVQFKGYYWRQNDQQFFDPDIMNKPAERALIMMKAKAGVVNALTSFVTGKGVVT